MAWPPKKGTIRKVTIGVIIATIVVWIAWDIPAYLSGEDGGTISEAIGDAIMAHPFMVGGGLLALLAHFVYQGIKRRRRRAASAKEQQ